mgnify:CR=1 FL=1
MQLPISVFSPIVCLKLKLILSVFLNLFIISDFIEACASNEILKTRIKKKKNYSHLRTSLFPT